jgi:carbon starvation protein
MMFVTIACGAISGFHSLVASGTTSKQIANELDAKKIGYGGMLTEGFLSVLALLSVSAGLLWLNYNEMMKKGNWIGTFGAGYGEIVKKILGSNTGKIFAIVMINSFVLTTLDTATRITRYITEELFGETLRIKVLKNRYIATIVIIIFAGYLAFGNWQKIWPVFGASNQLVAGIVLLLTGCYLISRKKKAISNLIPAVIMFITTIVSLILIILSIFVLSEAINKIREVKYGI